MPLCRPVVVNAQGYWLLGPKDDVFAFMYPDRKDRTFAAAYPDVWRQMQTAPAERWRAIRAASSCPGRRGSVRRRRRPFPPSLFVPVATPRAFSDSQTNALKFNFAVAAFDPALLGGISLGLARHQIHRHEAEQLVRLSEARFRAVTETASDAVISADHRGIVRYFNPGAERIFGYAEQDMVGRLPSSCRSGFAEPIRRACSAYPRQPGAHGHRPDSGAGSDCARDGREFPDLARCRL
jgi:PAS domain S-box-containing protein